MKRPQVVGKWAALGLPFVLLLGCRSPGWDLKAGEERPGFVRILSVAGDCSYVKPGENAHTLETGMELGEGTVVATGPQAHVDLALPEAGGVRFSLLADGRLTIDSLHMGRGDNGRFWSKSALSLQAGDLSFESKNVREGATVEIQTSEGVIRLP